MNKKTTKPINMTKLKKTIDFKIESILKYLENHSNFQQIPTTQHPLSPRKTSSITEKSNIRQSTNTQTSFNNESIFLNINSSLTDISFQQESKSERRIPLKNFKSNTVLGSVQQESYEANQTKLENQRTLQKKINSSSSDSDSKTKIQVVSTLRIFGAPLIESNTYQEQKIIQPLITKKYQNSNSKSNQKRSSNKFSYQKLNKENGYCSPTLEQKTNLKRTQFSNCSAARRLFESFSGTQRQSKIISLQMIEKFKQETQQLSKKTRKQSQDNNVRTKLLKRILKNKSKN